MTAAPPPTASPATPSTELRLSIALRRILEATSPDNPLTLAMFIDTTGERAFGILMAFLCLPFLQPIPLPGLSIPFGIALLLLGIQLAIRKHRPWLPRRLLKIRLPQKFTAAFLKFLTRLFKPLEKIVRPRLLFMQNTLAMVLLGIALCIDALLLTFLPAFPGSNLIPAWMALIKILGITEEDGLCLLAGSILSLGGAAAVIYAVALGGRHLAAHW